MSNYTKQDEENFGSHCYTDEELIKIIFRSSK